MGEAKLMRMNTLSASQLLEHDQEKDQWWFLGPHWRNWGLDESTVIEVFQGTEYVFMEVRIYNPMADAWLLRPMVIPDHVPIGW